MGGVAACLQSLLNLMRQTIFKFAPSVVFPLSDKCSIVRLHTLTVRAVVAGENCKQEWQIKFLIVMMMLFCC